MSNIIEISTTVETHLQAQSLAQTLVEERLAACVQITGPIQSVYRWKGEICQSTEHRCTIKSAKQLGEKLIGRIVALHPYDEPEVLVLPVEGSSETYAKWLFAQLDLDAGDG